MPSYIRTVDKILQRAIGVGASDPMPPVELNLSLVISLKSDQARGRHAVEVRIEEPSGQTMDTNYRFPVTFEGEERGHLIVVQFGGMQLSEEGLHWFDIRLVRDAKLESQRLTRVPLRVDYQPIQTETGFG